MPSVFFFYQDCFCDIYISKLSPPCLVLEVTSTGRGRERIETTWIKENNSNKGETFALESWFEVNELHFSLRKHSLPWMSDSCVHHNILMILLWHLVIISFPFVRKFYVPVKSNPPPPPLGNPPGISIFEKFLFKFPPPPTLPRPKSCSNAPS